MSTKSILLLVVMYVAAAQSTFLASRALLERLGESEGLGGRLGAAAEALPYLANLADGPLATLRANIPILAPALPIPMMDPLSQGLGYAMGRNGGHEDRRKQLARTAALGHRRRNLRGRLL